MTQPAIVFQDFSFQYDSQAEPTIQHLNLTISVGEKIVIVGPSGSGKTTFAHCLNGVIPNVYSGKMTGNAMVNGVSIANISIAESSKSVGTVLQDTDGQFIGLTVAEDIAFILENDGIEQSMMHDRVIEAAELVKMAQHLHKRPQDLSGGQKQRVSMAGILVSEAPILLFDEPLANLDPKAGQEAVALIDQLQKETGATVVIVEHRLEDILTQPVDRIIVFNEGEIQADMTPNELLKTDILVTNGIREPLYLSALKYAGVNLTELNDLTNWQNLAKNPVVQSALARWQTSASKELQPVTEQRLLTLENIHYTYPNQKQPVLDDVSFTIHPGEKISIVGRNGAGKSTLLKAICGFVQPKGKLFWQEQDITAESIKCRADKIGYVMQNPNQMISQKMIYDEVALGLVLRGVAAEEIEKRVLNTLKVCGLYPFRNWPISALSFGQKKRVTIAAILVLEPELLILDEPTAGQDFAHYREMMMFINHLHSMGKTIIMITHDMHLMMEYSNRTIVINDGQVLADAQPIDILMNQSIVDAASLKVPTLLSFAQESSDVDSKTFFTRFITEERREQNV